MCEILFCIDFLKRLNSANVTLTKKTDQLLLQCILYKLS